MASHGASCKAFREADQGEIDRRARISATVVHEAVRKEGDYELSRPSSALAWSGFAAGLSMGMSLAGQGLLRAYLPNATWTPLLTSFGYTLGFLIVSLGRQQLFTENTLTAVIPFLVCRKWDCLLNVLRLWGIVLFSNLAGVFLFAWVSGNTDIFPPEAKTAFAGVGVMSMTTEFHVALLKGILSGWLIALMVWLLPAAESSGLSIIIIITYIVGLGGFSHIVAGSAEALYLVATGRISFVDYLSGFFAPVLSGNIIGGVSLTAALNHVQVIAGKKEKKRK